MRPLHYRRPILALQWAKATDIPAKEAWLVLLDGDLEKIPQIFDHAQKALAVARQSLFWASLAT